MQSVDRQDHEDRQVGGDQADLRRAAPGGRDQGDHGRPLPAIHHPGLTLLWWSGLAACAVALAWLGDLRGNPRLTVSLLLLAGGVSAAADWWMHRSWDRWRRADRRRVLATVLLGGLALRAVLLTVPPSLSDDVYRYRWDARVQAAGINPYRHPPASPSLADLRDPSWEGINYPRIRTIYPPVAQWLFALTGLFGDGLLPFQVSAVLGDLLAILLLWACLRRWRLPAWRVAIYAWSPLAAVETASSGHFEGWIVAALLATVYAIIVGRRTLSTILAAVAVGLKTWPLAFVPLAFRDRPRHRAILLAGLVAVLYLPYLGAGSGILQPWIEYTGRWLFNDAGLALLRLATGSLAGAKAVAVAAWTGLLAWLWRRGVDPIRGGYWTLLAAILLLPAIHPWYLLWALPLAAAALDVGWIAATILAPLAYWILVGAGGDPDLWSEPGWVRFAIYVPAAAIWVIQARRTGPPAPPGIPCRSPRAARRPVHVVESGRPMT